MLTKSKKDITNYERLFRFALALTVGSVAVGCSESEESVAFGTQTVIFGEDNRQEAFELPQGTVGQRISTGTVALVEASRLDLTKSNQVEFGVTTLGERYNLCSDERYRTQPSLAFCSGTLIAPDLVLTAGHCVDAELCASTKVVLGYQMQDSSTLSPINQDHVYSCSEVVVRSFDSVLDYAIIRLERPTVGVALAPVKVGALPLREGEGLVVAGYPSGLPLKIAGGATVLDGRERSADFFTADLDAFPGNSGGGVYAEDSGELVGVLVRGPNPGYESRNGESCFRAEQSDSETDTLIETVYVHHAIRAYCEVASDARLCACGDGTCNGSVGENTATCSEDCGSQCGDSACNGSENGNSCYSDCGYCGNSVCENAEQLRMNCPADCGCPPGLLPSAAGCVPIPGNVNGDDVIDYADVLAMKLLKESGRASAAADVDCNGTVDEADVKTLKRFVSGKLVTLPCNAVASIALGGQHSCVVMQSGRARCWGDNSLGQLGLGNTLSIGDNEAAWATSDVALNGAVVSLAVGSGHNCALLVDGSVQCWGDGATGKLGYGDTENVGDNESPASKGVLSLGAKATFVAVGGTHSCAILEGGTVRCWGNNDFGQLGSGTPDAIGDDELPTAIDPIVFDSPAVALALGFDFSCALLETGRVHCWGENFLERRSVGITGNLAAIVE
jgi:V8-like Glu-specific endopeptidase